MDECKLENLDEKCSLLLKQRVYEIFKKYTIMIIFQVYKNHPDEIFPIKFPFMG